MIFFDRKWSNMTIKDGKFYKGDKPVPLEFGNWEQIILMDRASRAYNALKGPGLPVDVSYQKERITASAHFNCLCGLGLSRDRDVDEEGDIEPLFGIVTCLKCKNQYELSENDNGELIVKLRKSGK